MVADGVDGSALADRRRPLRPATGAGVPTVVVARISLCRLGRGRGAGDRNGGGVATAGIARPAGDRSRRGGAQPAGMDRGAVAGPAGLNADGGGPASADLSQRVSAERCASAISASVNSSIVCISRAASPAWVTEPCRSNGLPYSVALSTPPRAHAPKQAVAAAKMVIQEAERAPSRPQAARYGEISSATHPSRRETPSTSTSAESSFVPETGVPMASANTRKSSNQL